MQSEQQDRVTDCEGVVGMFRQATKGEEKVKERVEDERLMEDGDGDVAKCNCKLLASQFKSVQFRLMRRRNSCQTVNFRLSSEGQKGVAAHWKGAKRRPCKACDCQLAQRPENEGARALNWSSSAWSTPAVPGMLGQFAGRPSSHGPCVLSTC